MPERFSATPRIARARSLRADSTDAERKLWSVLRSRQLGGAKFRRQVPVDRYFADFACMDAKLIVELDGGQHADQQPYDDARTARLQEIGWRVMRFWNNDVIENVEGVADDILAALRLATS
ncbi:MAG TPA: endonuclease domain-containing protein [Caulobacteraceae bacterium]|nr:endonuclease domain-containing protein [Caulobacteraceae bacterium]